VRTRTVPQMEEHDCGAACLAIVLAHHGRHESMHDLRTACCVSRDGATAAAIVRAARGYGLEAHGRRVVLPEDPAGAADLSVLAGLPVPAIALWRRRHFVVLEGRGRGGVHLNDPAGGRRRVTGEEFAAGFGGVALVFARGPGFRRGGDRLREWRSLRRRLAGSLPATAFSVLAGLLLAAPTIAVSLLVKVFTEQVLVLSSTVWLPAICAATAAAALVAVACTWLQQQAINRLQTRLAVVSSADFVWRLLHLSRGFFDLRRPGALVARVQANDALALLLSAGLTTAVVSVVTMAAYLAAMVAFDPRLASLAGGLALLDLLVLQLVARRRIAGSQELAREQQRRDGAAFSGLAGIESLKADGGEQAFFARWAGHQARALNASQRLDAAGQRLAALPTAMNLAATAAIVVVGGAEVLHSAIGLGAFVAVQVLAASFLAPVGALVGVGSDLLAARGQVTVLDDVLEAERDRPGGSGAGGGGTAVALSGALEVDRLTFGYVADRPPVIDGLSLRVGAGERVAVVGATGSGKSTIARLLVGLVEPWSGEVRFDGHPRARLAPEVLARRVAYVDQRTCLFEGSVAENLRFWDDSLSPERLVAAAEDACIADVIGQRGGIEAAWVEEEGRNFSGGERQRLELARALAQDPAVLVLDEATSALDTEVEARIDANLRRRGCTTIVFAHRTSTVRRSDRVVVVEDGRVVQAGGYDELLVAPGAYRRMVAGPA